MKHAVVLLSGGLDSTVLMAHLLAQGWKVDALAFDYGSTHNAQELPAASKIAAACGVSLKVASLDFIAQLYNSGLLKKSPAIPKADYDAPSMSQTVVPFRNGVMLSAAAGYAESIGAQAVAIAAHGGDHFIYPDCRPEFIAAMDAAIRAGTDEKVRILAPFANWSKARIVKRGALLGVDFSATWSCYAGGHVHCGECGTCRERKEAFKKARVVDPTRYLT